MEQVLQKAKKSPGSGSILPFIKTFLLCGGLVYTSTNETSHLIVWLLFSFNLLVILQLLFYFWSLFLAEHPEYISFVSMVSSRISHSANHLCPKESHVHSLFLVVPIKKPVHLSFEKLLMVFHLVLKN